MAADVQLPAAGAGHVVGVEAGEEVDGAHGELGLRSADHEMGMNARVREIHNGELV